MLQHFYSFSFLLNYRLFVLNIWQGIIKSTPFWDESVESLILCISRLTTIPLISKPSQQIKRMSW